MQFNSSASTKKKTKTMTILHLRKSIGLSPSLIKILPQMISQLSLIKRPWLATCVAVFAVVLINNRTAGPIQISRVGNEPEDGFTGYPPFSNGVARWGDYSAAAVDSDGSIWMATEYTPDLARTSQANWSTYITRYQP